MDLTIAYECSGCRQTFSEKLSDLFPGKKHPCPACGNPAHLTRECLKRFEAALYEFCKT